MSNQNLKQTFIDDVKITHYESRCYFSESEQYVTAWLYFDKSTFHVSVSAFAKDDLSPDQIEVKFKNVVNAVEKIAYEHCKCIYVDPYQHDDWGGPSESYEDIFNKLNYKPTWGGTIRKWFFNWWPSTLYKQLR